MPTRVVRRAVPLTPRAAAVDGFESARKAAGDARTRARDSLAKNLS